MEINGTPMTTFSRELVGEQVQVGDFAIKPVARVNGRRWVAPEGNAAGGFGRISPTELRVSFPDGTTTSVPVTNPGTQAMLGMLKGTGATAAICVLVMVVARVLGRFKRSPA